jgi:predicted NBD/HSP70 family sugar kinase
MIVSAPALGWRDTILKPGWETRFSLPVIVENKARAAAMAEAHHGAARGVKDFAYVSIGTDLGIQRRRGCRD